MTDFIKALMDTTLYCFSNTAVTQTYIEKKDIFSNGLVVNL